jgi:hypothetical protein
MLHISVLNVKTFKSIAKVLTTGLFKSKVIPNKKKLLKGKEFTSIILEDPLED